MSLLTDVFEGNFGNVGNDISHTGSSLMSHPDELAETIGGAAALATGGLALGGELPFLGAGAGADAAAGGGGLFSSIFGGGADASAFGGGDALALTAPDAAAYDPIGAAIPGLSGTPTAASGTAIDAAGNTIGGLGGAGATPAGFASTDAELAGATTGVGGTAATPGAASQPGFFSGITDSIMHPTLGGVGKVAGVAAAGAGLGFDLLKGNPTDPNQKVLEGQAGQLGAQGQQLMSYLSKGTLPPALKAQLTQAVSAEKARIISGYAARGQPTDPNQNSALAQELNSVDTNAVAAMAQAQIQMMQTGLQETGLSTQLYETLTKLDQQNNQQLMQAISSFAAALGGGGGQTVRLAT